MKRSLSKTETTWPRLALGAPVVVVLLGVLWWQFSSEERTPLPRATSPSAEAVAASVGGANPNPKTSDAASALKPSAGTSAEGESFLPWPVSSNDDDADEGTHGRAVSLSRVGNSAFEVVSPRGRWRLGPDLSAADVTPVPPRFRDARSLVAVGGDTLCALGAEGAVTCGEGKPRRMEGATSLRTDAGDGVIVETRSGQRFRLGSTPADAPESLPGLPSREGSAFVSARLGDDGTVHVYSIDAQSRVQRFSRAVTSLPRVDAMLLVDTDEEGRLYVLFQSGSPPEAAQVTLMCLHPQTGATLGEGHWETPPGDTFAAATVVGGGQVVYASAGREDSSGRQGLRLSRRHCTGMGLHP